MAGGLTGFDHLHIHRRCASPRFNMKERCFKFEAMVDQTVVHYASDGWLLHKSSEEARRQADAERAEAEAAARFQAEVERAAREKEAGMDVEPPDDSRRLRNQVGGGAGGRGWRRLGVCW
jgi:hypothetical protein